MKNASEYRDLGMDRRLARRDFLNGIAIAVTEACAAAKLDTVAEARQAITPPAGRSYPPALTGLRGNDPASVAAFDPLKAGAFRARPAEADPHEEYDLVIVGAGISGLAAAHFWRRALGTERRILLVDNHDDFGGHARRNEFTYGGRTFLAYG